MDQNFNHTVLLMLVAIQMGRDQKAADYAYLAAHLINRMPTLTAHVWN